MRLTNFINESSDFDHADVINTLLHTCMPYLKDRKFDHKIPLYHLYSGRDRDDDFFEGVIRENRVPKDTPYELHKELDEIFYKKFGIKARSNSLFTTGNSSQASSYGRVYIIFPKGQYTVIWSDEIDDLYIHIREIYTSAIGIPAGSFDYNEGISGMMDYSDDSEYDTQQYIEDKAEEEYKKYYGEDTKGGIWTYTFDGYDSEELEKLGIKKGHKRDIFIKGFSKEKVKDMLHDRYKSLYPKNLIWSPDISLEDFTDKHAHEYEEEFKKTKVEEIEHTIDKGMKDIINTYNSSDVEKAILSNREIMLITKHGYCALDATKDFYRPVFEYFKIYGYNFPVDTKKKIGQEKWDTFKEENRFLSDL